MDRLERNSRLLLAGILLVAAGARIAALVSLEGTVYFDALLTDERAYHEWAIRIADGSFASRAVYELAPLPAYIMAVVYRLFGPDVLYVRIMNIAFGVAACALVYAIGRDLGGKAVGLASCLAAALYEQLVFYSVVPLKESLSVLVTAASAVLLLRILGESSFRRAAAFAAVLGLLAGLAVHVRGSFAAALPVYLVFATLGPKGLARSAGRRAVVAFAVAAGFSIALSPVAARNHEVSGQLALTTAQTGRNLFYGNNPDNPTPYYLPSRFASSVPGEQAVQFVIEASRREGRKLTQEEASEFWTREVVRYAAQSPRAFLEGLGLKALAVVNRFESSDHYHVGFLSRFDRFFALPLLPLWLVLPLGLAGMVVLGRRSRSHAALVALAAAHGATLVAFTVNARYRLPLVVFLIPFAVSGGASAWRELAARRYPNALGFAGAAALFAAIELLSLPGTGDLSGYASTHALLLDRRGERAEAIRLWEEASAMGGAFSPVADLFLAGKAAERGDMKAAISRAEAIPDGSFAAAQKFALLGDLRLHQGDARGAAAAYERSLGINAGQRRIRRELIRLYARLSPEKIPAARAELAEIESFFAGN